MANTTGKKFGGRQKGTPNRLTRELRAVLKDLIHEELETLQERMDHLDSKERLGGLGQTSPVCPPQGLPGISHHRRALRVRFDLNPIAHSYRDGCKRASDLLDLRL